MFRFSQNVEKGHVVLFAWIPGRVRTRRLGENESQRPHYVELQPDNRSTGDRTFCICNIAAPDFAGPHIAGVHCPENVGQASGPNMPGTRGGGGGGGGGGGRIVVVAACETPNGRLHHNAAATT